MLIGRDSELNILQNAYEQKGFHLVMLGGRLGVGKSTLISEFIKGKKFLWFTAEAVNDRMNLDLFARLLDCNESFDTWDAAFHSLAVMCGERTVVVVDNLHHLRTPGGGFIEALNSARNCCLATSDVLLILVSDLAKSALENQAHQLGANALYLAEFDYYDASAMLEVFSNEDKIRFYACLGGMPKYLATVDPSLSFEENIRNLFFKPSGMLYTEPFTRAETDRREPLVYNSILRAIACGHNKLNTIVAYSGEEKYKVAKYLRVLVDEDVIRRVLPFGKDAENARNGIYQIVDRSYLFWYRFIFGNQAVIDCDDGKAYADSFVFGKVLEEFVDETALADICQQHLIRRTVQTPVEIGKWWNDRMTGGVISLSKEDCESMIVVCNGHGVSEPDKITDYMNRNYPLGPAVKRRYVYMARSLMQEYPTGYCEVWNSDTLFG